VISTTNYPLKGEFMTTFGLENGLRFNPRYLDQAQAPALEPPRSLPQVVESAVRRIDIKLLKPVAPAHAGPAFQSSALLALLTFCYARQVYSSAVIAEQLRRDFTLFKVDGYGLPGTQVLQQFRAFNRWPLDLCLRSALFFLAQEKIRQGIVTHVKEEYIKEEASRRIVMAMFTDSLEMERENQPQVRVQPRFRISGGNGSNR
jgi:hypothetical protein